MGRDDLVWIASVNKVVHEEQDIRCLTEGNHFVVHYHQNGLNTGLRVINKFLLHSIPCELQAGWVVHTRPDVPVTEGVEGVPGCPIGGREVVLEMVPGIVGGKPLTPRKGRFGVSEPNDNTPCCGDCIRWTILPDQPRGCVRRYGCKYIEGTSKWGATRSCLKGGNLNRVVDGVGPRIEAISLGDGVDGRPDQPDGGWLGSVEPRRRDELVTEEEEGVSDGPVIVLDQVTVGAPLHDGFTKVVGGVFITRVGDLGRDVVKFPLLGTARPSRHVDGA